MEALILSFIGWLAMTAAGYMIGDTKGVRWSGFWLCLLFGPAGLYGIIVVACLLPVPEGHISLWRQLWQSDSRRFAAGRNEHANQAVANPLEILAVAKPPEVPDSRSQDEDRWMQLADAIAHAPNAKDEEVDVLAGADRVAQQDNVPHNLEHNPATATGTTSTFAEPPQQADRAAIAVLDETQRDTAESAWSEEYRLQIEKRQAESYRELEAARRQREEALRFGIQYAQDAIAEGKIDRRKAVRNVRQFLQHGLRHFSLDESLTSDDLDVARRLWKRAEMRS